MDQKTKAILHFERELKSLRIFRNTSTKGQIINKQNKFVGMLSLAKELEIISSEEYEQYFEEIFN